MGAGRYVGRIQARIDDGYILIHESHVFEVRVGAKFQVSNPCSF